MSEQIKQEERAKALAECAYKALDGKKAFDLKILQVGSKTVIADYFVIASGTSNTHVHALADETEFVIERDLGIKPERIEGVSDNGWTLMDYGSVAVHIFTPAMREYYKLDKLWEDAHAAPSLNVGE